MCLFVTCFFVSVCRLCCCFVVCVVACAVDCMVVFACVLVFVFSCFIDILLACVVRFCCFDLFYGLCLSLLRLLSYVWCWC